MKIGNGLSAQPEVSQQYSHTPIPLIIGPLIGLGYIIALPFAGLVIALFLVPAVWGIAARILGALR